MNLWVSFGVPQGGHLSPLLFLIFINDINKIFLNCDYLLFANDLKVFCQINEICDCYKIQNDLDTFATWFTVNCMSVNANKCVQISFVHKHYPITYQYKINGTPLSIVNEIWIKDLGVIPQNI